MEHNAAYRLSYSVHIQPYQARKAELSKLEFKEMLSPLKKSSIDLHFYICFAFDVSWTVKI